MTASRRIRGVSVPALLPPAGAVHTLLLGEAPGPRGADQSCVPFLGDRAGRLVYAALVEAGAAQFPVPFAECRAWDGATFRARKVRPVLSGVALTNAYPACPTDDGQHFRAPTRAELAAPANQRRLRRLLAACEARGLRQVICLGRVAAFVVTPLVRAGLTVHSVPHPAAQGLLQAAPGKGKGMALATLERAWITGLVSRLR